MLSDSIFYQRFMHQVQRHTKQARRKFTTSGWHPENDAISWTDWMAIAGEEFGKAVRCANKLMIAQDEDVIREWKKELYHRIITVTSVLTRMAKCLIDEDIQKEEQ